MRYFGILTAAHCDIGHINKFSPGDTTTCLLVHLATCFQCEFLHRKSLELKRKEKRSLGPMGCTAKQLVSFTCNVEFKRFPKLNQNEQLILTKQFLIVSMDEPKPKHWFQCCTDCLTDRAKDCYTIKSRVEKIHFQSSATPRNQFKSWAKIICNRQMIKFLFPLPKPFKHFKNPVTRNFKLYNHDA